jgi:hypothetical protein
MATPVIFLPEKEAKTKQQYLLRRLAVGVRVVEHGQHGPRGRQPIPQCREGCRREIFFLFLTLFKN